MAQPLGICSVVLNKNELPKYQLYTNLTQFIKYFIKKMLIYTGTVSLVTDPDTKDKIQQ